RSWLGRRYRYGPDGLRTEAVWGVGVARFERVLGHDKLTSTGGSRRLELREGKDEHVQRCGGHRRDVRAGDREARRPGRRRLWGDMVRALSNHLTHPRSTVGRVRGQGES